MEPATKRNNGENQNSTVESRGVFHESTNSKGGKKY